MAQTTMGKNGANIDFLLHLYEVTFKFQYCLSNRPDRPSSGLNDSASGRAALLLSGKNNLTGSVTKY